MIRHNWKKDELLSLYKMPILELIFKSATVHRQFNNPSELQMCHLISIKTGGCSEDCKYCSQSSRYTTSVKAQPFMKIEEVIKRAESAKSKGATRVCLGSAWRQIRDSKQFDEILKMVKTIDKMGLEVCCTLGMLNVEQAQKLKDAGLYAYNHNLDTSDKYYKQIITSRTYEDRLKTLSAVREANISVCCGGIIGLGEKVEDRIRLIQTLSSFTSHPESVPINRLIPIKGTPFGDKKQVSIWDLIRTIAVAKISMPKSMIRLSAGREKMTCAEQSLCFLAGANSIFIGEKLLTAPNKNLDQDDELFKTLDLQPRKSFKASI